MARQNCNLRFVPAIESQIGVNFSVVDWPAAQTALVKCQHIFGIIARLIFLYLTINRLLFRPWERTPRENTSLCKYEVKNIHVQLLQIAQRMLQDSLGR